MFTVNLLKNASFLLRQLSIGIFSPNKVVVAGNVFNWPVKPFVTCVSAFPRIEKVNVVNLTKSVLICNKP